MRAKRKLNPYQARILRTQADSCAMCKAAPSHVNSHIIPKFLYNLVGLTGDKCRKFFVISNDPRIDKDLRQTGIQEYLLCIDCEKICTELDTYGAKIMRQVHNSPPLLRSFRYAPIDVDYCRFKLFCLSLLWRIGASTFPLFDSINLGKHEPILRNMLLTHYPGELYEYGCVITKSSHNTENVSTLYCLGNSEIDGYPSAQLFLGPYHWIFFLRAKTSPELEKTMCLQPGEKLEILQTGSDHSKYLKNFSWDLENNRFFERFSFL